MTESHFSLPYDPQTAIKTLRVADPKLADLIDRAGPFQLSLRTIHSPFQALTRSIVYQQLSGKAAGTIFKRVCDLFPDVEYPQPQHIMDIAEETLRGAGMSWAKVRAVKDLADKTMEGVVPTMAALRDMDNDEIIKRLTAVRGIGPWTVEMLLIFSLGRPDVLPVSDLGVRKGYMLTYGLDALPKPAALRAHGEQWRPYRSVASWYFWRAVDDVEWGT